MPETSDLLEKSALLFLYNFHRKHSWLKLIIKKVLAENQCEKHKKLSSVVIQPRKTGKHPDIIGPGQEETCLWGFANANNKGADQPAHPRSLFSAFIIRLLAHLSRRLMGELIVYQSLRRPSVVRPSTFSNISSETTGPIKLKFHMETP